MCESRGLSFKFPAMSDTYVASRPITRGVAAAARSASNYAQNAFTAPARGRALDVAVESDSKLMTPERAGGRHRSPHGGDGNIDPFMTEDPWKSSSLQLSPAIIEAKRRVQMMRDTCGQAPPFPSETDNVQPSNADLMAKLDRMMGAMALTEDVHVAQL